MHVRICQRLHARLSVCRSANEREIFAKLWLIHNQSISQSINQSGVIYELICIEMCSYAY